MTPKRRRAALPATCLLVLLVTLTTRASGQSVKGGSNTNQLSSSFAQIFNSLSPVEQQQFVRQMSSSNRRILQQMLFAPQNNQFSSFDERFESTSIPRTQQVGATKSAKFSLLRQQQNKAAGSLSPVQQAQFIRNQQLIQQSAAALPASSADGGSSFSSEFFSSSRLPQPVRQQSSSSSFSRVQEVKQVSRPVVVQPVTESSSFRRVQSFSSQPLPVVQPQQFIQQSFIQKQQSQERPVIPASFNQFSSSSSSSSNLGGTSGAGAGYDASSGFSSAALQQEKLDSGSLENNFGIQQQQDNFDNVLDLSEEQQNNLLPLDGAGAGAGAGIGDGAADFNGGLMAASINNRWYIMKPIENPSALGLRRVRIPESQIADLARLRVAGPTRASGGAGVAAGSTTSRRLLSGKQEARASGVEEAGGGAAVALNLNNSGARAATTRAAASSVASGASFGAAGATEAPRRSGAPPAAVNQRTGGAGEPLVETEKEEESSTETEKSQPQI